MSTHHKHVLNDPATLVVDSLRGLCTINPLIDLDETQRVVFRRNHPRNQVALISGGGSGHEPAHAAFVGEGLLSAAVCGNVFASPNAGQIRRAIELVENDKGTLVVVKNYTGDVLNFGLASEQYKAGVGRGKGDVRMVVVGDDVAVGRTQGGLVGRRGLAGTILVYKIAAALAQSEASLDEVEAVAKLVAANVGTIGVGLEHCHVPGTESGRSHLGADEIELGMGIHNEPGNQTLRPIPPLNELIDHMLSLITSTTDLERSFIPFNGSDQVVLLVNNLGGISELELGGIAGEAIKWLSSKGYTVKRALVGTFMTSLSMPGFSLTVLRLPSEDLGTERLLELLDHDADAPGWKWYAKQEVRLWEPGKGASKTIEEKQRAEEPPLVAENSQAFINAIKRAAECLIEAEPEITRQDQIAGDGDAGLTLKAGAEGVLEAISNDTLSTDNITISMLTISQIVDSKMGGTSGALYSIFFSGLAKSLRDQAESGTSKVTKDVWVGVAKEALETLQKYTRARPPSRTLMDPLTAFVEALPDSLDAAVKAAQLAAEGTRKIPAKAGRAAYVDQKTLEEADVPDPGAWGVAVLAKGLWEGSRI